MAFLIQKACGRAMELLTRFGLKTTGKENRQSFPAASSSVWRWQGAVAAKPRLLLLDEPTSALDPEYTTEVLEYHS